MQARKFELDAGEPWKALSRGMGGVRPESSHRKLLCENGCCFAFNTVAAPSATAVPSSIAAPQLKVAVL